MKRVVIAIIMVSSGMLGPIAPLGAKEKAAAGPLPVPGQAVRIGGVEGIYLEQGRYLLWPKGSSVTFKGSDGTVLAQVDLSSKPKKQSGAEAMGLEVEETDLGGAQGSKAYLSGKKKPQGRSFNASGLSGKSPAEAGTVSKMNAAGIPLTLTQFPNGSFSWKWEWPDLSEEVYFDRRKTMVYNQQTQTRGPWQYTLRQYADGSFVRSYKSTSGTVDYTYDTNDKSYNLTFLNPQGEAVTEISCSTQGCQEN